MIYDPDIEEFIGPPKSKKAIEAVQAAQAAAKPRMSNAARTLELLTRRNRHDADDLDQAPSLDMTDVFGGVSVGWLSKVFGMDPSDVKRRLADCPAIHRKKSGYLYSLPVAARYLVKPVFDVEKYLANMKPSELPPQLQDTYWKSALNRQKFELNAGELWRTADVLEVLGEVFKTIKFTMQLWADNLERATGLSETQRKALVQMVDALQNELHQSLVDLRTKRQTPPALGEEDQSNTDDGFGLI